MRSNFNGLAENLLHASVRRTHAGRKVEITAGYEHMVRHKWTTHSPVTWVEPVPLGFSVLNLNRKTHHYSSAQSNGSVNEFDCAELDITNSVRTSV